MTHDPLALPELEKLFAPFERLETVFLAVSGGPDSLALMHATAAWRNAKPRACAIVVLTVDHRLRPEAAGEAAWVCDQAAARGLSAECLRDDGAVPPASGIQAWARQLRYRLLIERARRVRGPAAIALAHHQDDLAETFLMRLARGSGVDGLSAMRAETRLREAVILRPFLSLPKSRLLATLDELHIEALADPSNELARFERVRLREARSARDALGLTDAALARTAHRLNRARQALEDMTTRFLQPTASDLWFERYGIARLNSPGPDERIPDEIAIRALSRIIAAVSGLSEAVRLMKIERIWAELNSAGELRRSLGGCILSKSKGRILIYREAGRRPLPVCEAVGQKEVEWDRRFELSVSGVKGGWRVRPVGSEDIRALNAAAFALPSMPRAALRTLPAVEDRDGLLAVPAIDFQRAGFSGAVCSTFMNAFMLKADAAAMLA